MRDRVRAGDVDNLTALQQGLCANAPTFIDWARSANLFRMRHITAAYRLPDSWLPGAFKNVTISASAKNLFLIAPDFRGLDPESVEDPTTPVFLIAPDFRGLDPESVEDPTTPGENNSNAGVGFRYSYYNWPVPRSFVFKLAADF